MTTVRVIDVGPQTVLLVDAAEGAELDPAWRVRWAEAARAARCEVFGVSRTGASARVVNERASALVALAEEHETSPRPVCRRP